MMKTVYDACEIKGGYTPKNEQLFDSGDIPYFKVSDMNREGNHKYMISTELFLRGSNKVFPAGSIVFPKNGGAVLTNKKRVLASDSVVDLNTGIALPKKGTDSKYLFYFFQNLDFRKFIKEGTLPVLRIKEINELPLYLPDIEEQDRIVKILDAAFEKIDALKQNAEKSLQEVKNLWEATLREELKPKEGWKKKSLSEICLKITDGSHNPPKGLDHSEYLMLSSKNVRNDRFSFENPRYLSKFDFENEEKRTKVEKGDVFLTIVGAGLGDCCVYNHSDKITLQRSVCVLKPNKATSSRFLMYLLQSSYERIHKESNGAAQKGIYLNQLSQFLVEMPNIEEQRRVEISLDKISTICQTLQRKYEQELAEYEALKQSILRKAFSGEL